MVQTVEYPKSTTNLRSGVSKCSKLASCIIWGTGNCSLEEESIRRVIENTIGTRYPISVQIESDNHVRITINSEDEVLETKGLMQLSVFSVMTALCQELKIRVNHLENEYLPEYA